MSDQNTSVAYIIGGTSGIGLATAAHLLKQGVDVCLTGRSTHHIAAAKEQLSPLGNVEVIQSDLYRACRIMPSTMR